MTELTTPTKTFNLAQKDGYVAIVCKELTIRQRKQLNDKLVENLKAKSRQETLALAKILPDADRIKFLVEASKQNIVSDEDMKAYRMTDEAVKETLVYSCTPMIAEDLWQDNAEEILKAYLFSLGVVEDDVEDKKAEGKQDSTFPQ